MSMKRYFTHYRSLISLGIPIVVGQVGNMVLGFADTLMIGHYGMKELAAASFVTNMTMLIILFSMGYSYGLTPLVGQMFGQGETDKIGRSVRAGVVANTLLAAVLVAVALMLYHALPYLGLPSELLPYMRPYLMVNIVSLPFVCWLNTYKQFFDAIGHTRIPMMVILSGNVVNILGNYLLIYGYCGCPELGLVGAGVATLFSRVLMSIAFVVIFFTARPYRAYRESFLRQPTDRQLFRRLNALGWPLAFQMSMEASAFSLVSIIVGWIGTLALAAHQIVATLSQLFFMVYYGLAAAVSVRVSHFSGQRDFRSAYDTAAAGFHLVLLVAVLVAVPFFLLRHQIGLLFTSDASVCQLVAQLALVIIVYQFGDGLQITYSNALRGIACVRPLVYISFFSYFVTSLPLSWFFGIYLGYGLLGVWGAFPISLTIAGVLYYWRFKVSTLKSPA